MKLDKLLKEALSFSKMEKIKYSEFKGYNVTREGYMKVSRVVLIVSLVVLVSLVGVFLFYDKIFVPQHSTTASVEEVESKGPSEKVVEKVEVKPTITSVEEVKSKEPTKRSIEEVKIKEPSRVIAVVSMVLGDVKVQNVSGVSDLEVGYKLKEGDTIITSADSECEVQIDKKILVRISENTKVSFHQIVSSVGKGKHNVLELLSGSLKSAIKGLGKDEFKVKSSTAVAAVRGTSFSVSVNEKHDTVIVVSKGKVGAGIRSKVMQDLIHKYPEQFQGIDDYFVGSTLKEGEGTAVSVEDQSKLDSALSEILEEAETINKEVISKLISVGKKAASTIIKVEKKETLDARLEVKKVDEVKEVIAQKEKTLGGSKVLSGYGRWPVYAQKYLFYTPSGISTFDGEKIGNINISGDSYSVYDDKIIVVAKDQNDYLVVKVADISGKVLGEINLGEVTKGTLVIGRPALIGNTVFAPSISGVHIIDITTGAKRVIRVGTVYSDLALFDQNNVISVNEIGEIYLVNASGGRKISQLSTTTVRRGILASSSDRVYILVDNSMHIVDRGGGVKMVNLGIRPESELIVYADKVIVAGEKKVLIMNKDGVILRTIGLSGNLVVSPYVGDGYVVVTATDGVHVYSIETGNQEYKFDIIGNIAFIYNKKLYVVRDTDTMVIDLK